MNRILAVVTASNIAYACGMDTESALYGVIMGSVLPLLALMGFMFAKSKRNPNAMKQSAAWILVLAGISAFIAWQSVTLAFFDCGSSCSDSAATYLKAFEATGGVVLIWLPIGLVCLRIARRAKARL
jgi:hypothetical protein